MSLKIYIKKVITYCIGLLIMALGVSISKASGLGVSPVNSIPAVMSNITEIDMGICTTIVFTAFILIQIIIMRKEFRLFNLLQIVCSFLFGLFVSGSNYLCKCFLPDSPNYFVSLVYLLISMILVALGILLYLNAEILSLPGEGVMQAISYKSKMKLSTAKILFDWTMIIIATVLSLIFLGGLDGVREGTVIAAFGVGLCLKAFELVLQKPLRNAIYGSQV